MPSRKLLLYSVVALNEAGLRELESLGEPALMVVPHRFHTLDAPFYAERYPNLVVVAPEQAATRLRRRSRVDASPEQALGTANIRFSIVPGVRFTEVVLDLDIDGGRALVFTDVVSSRAPAPNLVERVMGPPREFGVARAPKLLQVRNKAEVRGYLQGLSELPDIRALVPAHGPSVTVNCRENLLAAAKSL